MMRTVAVLFLCLAGVAHAADSGEARYERCLASATSQPKTAYREAQAWAKDGGGAPARHCMAISLVVQKEFSKAAGMLDELSQDEKINRKALRATIAAQAGNAWMLANKPKQADASFSLALTLDPADDESRIDRARARAKLADWRGADEDLSQVLDGENDRIDLLLLRASARHARGKIGGAWSDLERILFLDPKNAAALLERGAIRYETGDKKGARSDWQSVMTQAPKSAEAQRARKQLERMSNDATSEDQPPALKAKIKS